VPTPARIDISTTTELRLQAEIDAELGQEEHRHASVSAVPFLAVDEGQHEIGDPCAL
jgi:hypothetical protein